MLIKEHIVFLCVAKSVCPKAVVAGDMNTHLAQQHFVAQNEQPLL